MQPESAFKKLLESYPAYSHVHTQKEQKKSGGTRTVIKPDKELKQWLRRANKLLNKHFLGWPAFMHGGIKTRSYVTYARPHVGKPCVITVDIKACFDTIAEDKLLLALQKHLTVSQGIGRQLTEKLCYRGTVPQGFPTSNFLSNLYLLDVLTKLHGSFGKKNLEFGNYVDDIAVSGTIKDPAAVINEIATELSRVNLKMNKAKVKVMPQSVRQVVCGLLVNKRLTLTRQLRISLLSQVAKQEMGQASLAGWLSNLANVDLRFRDKLQTFASKKK